MVSSDDLKKYSLKQFVHNDSGQFLVGEFEDNLYLLVAGTVYSTLRVLPYLFVGPGEEGGRGRRPGVAIRLCYFSMYTRGALK